ncbi:hypothetical protein BsWGS_23746 [Bradybaena similaris]
MATEFWLLLCLMTSTVTVVAPQQSQVGSKDWVLNYLNTLSQAKNRKLAAEPRVACQWKYLKFLWPCDYVRDFFLERGMYVPADSVLAGVQVYNNETFVTVHRASSTVPAGLNKVVLKDGESLLQPYPNLKDNEVGKCSNLQYPIASVTDPYTGCLYVIDIGGVKPFSAPSKLGVSAGNQKQTCPPKLVVLDTKKNGAFVGSYDLDSAEPRSTSYLKKIVLYHGDENKTRVTHAFITDPGNQRLIVFDFDTNTSHSFDHNSMECGSAENSTTESKYSTRGSISGIAVDPEGEYVYYVCRDSQQVSQIPTAVLRDKLGDFAGSHRFVGNATTQTDSLVCGKHGLYYADVDASTVYRWNITKDMEAQNVTKKEVIMKNQEVIFKIGTGDYLIDSLSLDNNGTLWLAQRAINPNSSGTKGNNNIIYRQFVNDTNNVPPVPKK